MAESLISVGLDIGTTTTQLIISKLFIENTASAFSIPEMKIANREILYKSAIHFTPLATDGLMDGDKIRHIVEAEYDHAGISRKEVNTGALIITGESSRKENAKIIAASLSEIAGDFVVATAGPHLESTLAAKGSGAEEYSAQVGKTVLHIDIGGGTSNLALIRNGTIVSTGCMNIGGRLLKLDENGRIYYRSPILSHYDHLQIGTQATSSMLQDLCHTMVHALEMACGLRESTPLLNQFWTAEAGNPWLPPNDVAIISFSGGVAHCIENEITPLTFGDIGPVLGQCIRNSLLCQSKYRIANESIRATVIGAGSYATQLSGSTVFSQNIQFPLKNLPVATQIEALSQLDQPGILYIPPQENKSYAAIIDLAEKLIHNWPFQAIYIATQSDMAKALGHALALRTSPLRRILCIDRVQLSEDSYLDVGNPIGSTFPIIIKTLIWQTESTHHPIVNGGSHEAKNNLIG